MKLTTDELDQVMDWISSYSDEEGPGTTRLLYSPAWVKAHVALTDLFKANGFDCQVDGVGNILATIKGSAQPEAVIASGSHIDTVVKGGRLDGQLGIMAAYLSIKELVAEHGQPKKSLQVVVTAEEEGSRFPYIFWGANHLVGEAKKGDVRGIQDVDGLVFEEVMKQAGYDLEAVDEQEHANRKIETFIELHIEQGGSLEATNKKVGIVNAIVGSIRYDIRLKGLSNHAGTTPMGMRKDTVVAMSKMITNAIDKAVKLGDPLVLTFGQILVKPNVVNVVPGETHFTLDCRHTDGDVLRNFVKEIIEDMQVLAVSSGIEIELEKWLDSDPVPMDPDVVSLLAQVADEQGQDYVVMHSGAGHDSQIFAPKYPTAMLFVPSDKGISHSPLEHTDAQDILPGIEVLKEALYRLAY